MIDPSRVALTLVAVVLCACGSGPPPPSTAEGVRGIAVAPAPTPSLRAARAPERPARAPEPKLGPPVDEKAVAAATGVVKPEVSDGVVKVSFPRADVSVAVDGWKMPPFMGLTSWAAFGPARDGVEAMVMGDLVLFEDEVNPVMSVLLDGGLEVTALHNHFFFDQPHVYFMHIGGEGSVATLGKGVKLAMEKVGEVRKKAPRPATGFGGAPIPKASSLDPKKLEAALGVAGQSKDGMFKIVVGRSVKAACGCPAGKAMGVTTWAAFAGTEADAVVDGDFSVTEGELQTVLKELRGGGVNVVAIHHHMSGESPRLLFLHYWGRGKAVDLAGIIKRALAKTASG